MTKQGLISLAALIAMACCAYYIYKQYFAPTVELYYMLSNPCKSFYLSDDEKQQAIDKIENGYNSLVLSSDGNTIIESKKKLRILANHYEFCEPSNADETHYYFKRYEFIDPMVGSNFFWDVAIRKYRLYDKDDDRYNPKDKYNYRPIDETLSNMEKAEANGDYRARALLASVYDQNWSRIFSPYLNIPKSLYYSKLDGCDTNKEYSYASYLHTLFHNYPDNKEYIKVAYAMLLFTKFNAKNFYNYSNFETLEQNMTSRLDSKEVSYVIRNYQDIINKECEGILADHRLIPTEAKLNRYAFPLKSDAQQE